VRRQEPSALALYSWSCKVLINDAFHRKWRRATIRGEVCSLRMSIFTPPELGFIRAVSWFYILYNEIGKISVEFIVELLHAYNLDPERKVSSHLNNIQQMRTFLQHNLDPRKDQNRRIQEACEQWLNCVIGLLVEAINSLNCLRDCIRKIEEDESREQIFSGWDLRLKRYHPPHAFDDLIQIVAADMGRDSIDTVRLRQRFYEKWMKELELQQGSYDFEIEARKLIERVLIVETTPVLPITGKDIIKEFDIPPGPQVGELLKLARILYDAEPCSREALLEKLHQKVDVDII